MFAYMHYCTAYKILHTVELSRTECIEFATSSRRLPTDLVEKMETERVESS